MTTPLQRREGEGKKSIIVELLSLNVLQITCAEAKKKLPRIRSADLNSISRQWQADRKGNKPQWDRLKEIHS